MGKIARRGATGDVHGLTKKRARNLTPAFAKATVPYGRRSRRQDPPKAQSVLPKALGDTVLVLLYTIWNIVKGLPGKIAILMLRHIELTLQ